MVSISADKLLCPHCVDDSCLSSLVLRYSVVCPVMYKNHVERALINSTVGTFSIKCLCFVLFCLFFPFLKTLPYMQTGVC